MPLWKKKKKKGLFTLCNQCSWLEKCSWPLIFTLSSKKTKQSEDLPVACIHSNSVGLATQHGWIASSLCLPPQKKNQNNDKEFALRMIQTPRSPQWFTFHPVFCLFYSTYTTLPSQMNINLQCSHAAWRYIVLFIVLLHDLVQMWFTYWELLSCCWSGSNPFFPPQSSKPDSAESCLLRLSRLC